MPGYTFKRWTFIEGGWFAVLTRPNGGTGEYSRRELDAWAEDMRLPDSFRTARLEALACEPTKDTPFPERHDEAME